MEYNALLQYPPYQAERDEKKDLLTKRLVDLTKLHMEHCAPYRNIVRTVFCGNCEFETMTSLEQLPFLPVSLFKNMDLLSVPRDQVVKTMTSSGTTGQQVSKIYLDRATASYQQKTLVKIVSDYLGTERLPMILLDCPSVIKNRAMFSARGAGILGFSIFGTKKIYAFNDAMELQLDALKEFLEKYQGQKILLFGFTFMIWQFFYKALVKHRNCTGETLDLSKGILIHGGGWKKLKAEAVSKPEFKQRLYEACRMERVHDYYGMVEQTGCIYMECECGHLHASVYSDVLIRRMKDFKLCNVGEKGALQVFSAIPESYPGHSLLTEDEGILLGEDDCPCGRKGKYFEVVGRIKYAETRGCSDTYESK